MTLRKFLDDTKHNRKLRNDFLKAVGDFAEANGYELTIDELAQLELGQMREQPRRRPVDDGPRATTLAMGEEDSQGRMRSRGPDISDMTDAIPEEDINRASTEAVGEEDNNRPQPVKCPKPPKNG